jgi:hypothetical protein
MLTEQQRDEFHRFGILRVQGAIPARAANAMCDSVWEMLGRRYGVRREDSESWNAQRIGGFKDRPSEITFEQVAPRGLRSIFDQLLGQDAWERSENWGSLLVSFPGAYPEPRDGAWYLPHQGWHLDAPVVRSLSHLYGLRVFTCLAEVSHAGGATLAVAGSARLAQGLAEARGVAKIRSADVRKGLVQRYSWLKDLCSFDSSVDRVQRFMTTTTALEGAEVRVVEMTGEPSDVYLMHPLMLHAASPNCLAVPRMALSSTVYQRGVDWNALYGPEREAADQIS